MCGITGVINAKNKTLERIELMTSTLYHRGPDFQNSCVFGNHLLGHTRLSIIDVEESSHQPMISKCGNYAIVFNGEIYNYKALRSNLVAKGYSFRSDGDTEVLLNLLISYGEEAVQMLNGMFAFCFINKASEEVLLVRDRLGIKPLYYHCSKKGEVIFGSEVKSILASGGVEKRLNYNSISSFLSFRYAIGNESFYSEINQLEAGELVKIKSGCLNFSRYWEPKIDIQEESEEYYVQKVRQQFEQSVSERLIADVPVGAFLSGGVDSSGVVAEMRKQLPNSEINTYTIGFDDKNFNEFEYANIVAKQYGINHHSINYSIDEYWDQMDSLIAYKDAPLGVPNEPALYRMTQELNSDITVVLSGEGADEIFGGYGRIFRGAEDFSKFGKGFDHLLKERYPEQFDSESEFFLNQYRYISKTEKKKILSKDFYNHLKGDEIVDLPIKSYFDKLSKLDPKSRYMFVFEKYHLPGLLQRLDCTTMASSVEGRVPFVDHHLVELALRIPSNLKLKWNSIVDQNKGNTIHAGMISEKLDIPKNILKLAFSDRLHHDILYRKKMGFPIPLKSLLHNKKKDDLMDILRSSVLVKDNLFDLKYIDKLFDNAYHGSNNYEAQKIWMLLSLSIFVNKNF